MFCLFFLERDEMCKCVSEICCLAKTDVHVRVPLGACVRACVFVREGEKKMKKEGREKW